MDDQSRRLVSLIASVLVMALLIYASPGCGHRYGDVAMSAIGEPGKREGVRPITGIPVDSGLPGHALIYARQDDSLKRLPPAVPYDVRWDVVWLPPPCGETGRVVYAGGPKLASAAWLPAYFGFLPSPDGQHLCVWETAYDESSGWLEPRETIWTMVDLPGGRKSEIHAQSGLAGYLPFWLSNRRLLLEKGNRTAVFDVDAARLTPGLPASSVPQARYGTYGRDVDDDILGEAWREQFALKHLRQESSAFNQALSTLKEQLGVTDFLTPREHPRSDRAADMLLRPMGIVSRSGYRASKLVWPSVAVSSDGRRIARAAVVKCGEVSGPGAEDTMVASTVFEARVDAYEVPSGVRLWGMCTPWTTTLTVDVPTVWLVLPGEPWFSDLRWSSDGQYLSFTRNREWWCDRPSSVSVIEASSWREVVRIPNARNAFVLPVTGN